MCRLVTNIRVLLRIHCGNCVFLLNSDSDLNWRELRAAIPVIDACPFPSFSRCESEQCEQVPDFSHRAHQRQSFIVSTGPRQSECTRGEVVKAPSKFFKI